MEATFYDKSQKNTNPVSNTVSVIECELGVWQYISVTVYHNEDINIILYQDN